MIKTRKLSKRELDKVPFGYQKLAKLIGISEDMDHKDLGRLEYEIGLTFKLGVSESRLFLDHDYVMDHAVMKLLTSITKKVSEAARFPSMGVSLVMEGEENKDIQIIIDPSLPEDSIVMHPELFRKILIQIACHGVGGLIVPKRRGP